MPRAQSPRVANERADLEGDEAEVVKLLYRAFFGHLTNYQNIADNSALISSTYGETLLEILTDIYDDIARGQFDRQRHATIDDLYINKHFKGRHFNQHNDKIRDGRLPYLTLKSVRIRYRMAAIAAVAKDIFSDEPPEFDYVRQARTRLTISRERRDHSTQLALFRAIETEMRRIEARPDGAISFDGSNQPIIKTNRRDFFPSKDDVSEEQRWIAGSYRIYRRIFADTNDIQRQYVTEYLNIVNTTYGLTFQWYTRYSEEDRNVIIDGVGFFTDGALWLIGHCAEPFNRVRVLAASTREWRAHTRHERPTPYCTAEVMTHREEARGRHVPQSRRVLLRCDRTDQLTVDEIFFQRVGFHSEAELHHILSNEELAAITG